MRYILESIKKRHVSVKFNFEDIFNQIIDAIKPLLLIKNLQDDSMSSYEDFIDDN